MTDPTLDAIRLRRDDQRRIARSVTISQAQTEQDVDTLLDRLAAVEKARDAYMRGMIGQENRAIKFRKERDTLQAKLAACEAQWAFTKSHDSELDHVARLQQLEEKLAASENDVGLVEDKAGVDLLIKEGELIKANTRINELMDFPLTPTGSLLLADLQAKLAACESMIAAFPAGAVETLRKWYAEKQRAEQAEAKLALAEWVAGLLKEALVQRIYATSPYLEQKTGDLIKDGLREYMNLMEVQALDAEEARVQKLKGK